MSEEILEARQQKTQAEIMQKAWENAREVIRNENDLVTHLTRPVQKIETVVKTPGLSSPCMMQ